MKNEEIDKWMDAHCPWYLGRWKVSDDCDKTCPITAENRDTSMCPECYNDDYEMLADELEQDENDEW